MRQKYLCKNLIVKEGRGLIFGRIQYNYRSLTGKHSRALIFQCQFSLYWVLTVCKIEFGGINVAVTYNIVNKLLYVNVCMCIH